MDTELKKLKKLTSFMRKAGVLVVKTSEIEVHLSPTAILHEPDVSPDKKDEPATPQYSDEEILFWSTPGFSPEAPQG